MVYGGGGDGDNDGDVGGSGCYDSKLKGLSNELTLVLSNTRELDRVPNTK